MTAADSMAHALNQEEEERRLDNESWAHKVDELEAEIKRLREHARIVVVMEGGIIQNIMRVSDPRVDVLTIDYDAGESGDAEESPELVTMIPQDPWVTQDGRIIESTTAPAWVSQWKPEPVNPATENGAALLALFDPNDYSSANPDKDGDA